MGNIAVFCELNGLELHAILPQVHGIFLLERPYLLLTLTLDPPDQC